MENKSLLNKTTLLLRCLFEYLSSLLRLYKIDDSEFLCELELIVSSQEVERLSEERLLILILDL